MRSSNLKRPAVIRPLAICVCVLMTLLGGGTAHARARWKTPTLSGSPPTTDIVGQPYSFTPTASAPRGYTLTFSISGKPPWASFDTATGQLAGTPASADVGTSPSIVISVSDGVASASLAPFAITVSGPPNTAPTIAGTPPATDTTGTPYSFTPQAGDTDGDAISFSIQNKPAWASFSIANGTLSGTPAATDAGTYSNIVISVSDGQTSVSLAPFSIDVTQPVASGTATLTWTAPTTNTDGSALTDLAGYHIHYGNSPGALSTVIDVANAGATSYVVSSLASGTWYFAVSAYTTSGLESALSNSGSKSIP
ncbi:MAG TPA: putative Ig domain-containing protein [Steroidobacteraceae bacterium]|nr:putative Ig domain-containing protein [Steroidobacteraceae bacterium]